MFCSRAAWASRAKVFKSNILDLLFEHDAIGAMYPLLGDADEHDDILGGRIPGIHDEIPVPLGDLCPADAISPETHLVDEVPDRDAINGSGCGDIRKALAKGIFINAAPVPGDILKC